MGLLLVLLISLQQPTSLKLEEQLSPGTVLKVATQQELSGQLSLPDKAKVDLKGSGKTGYFERVLAASRGQVTKSVRLYSQLEMDRTIGKEQQQEQGRPNQWKLAILNRQPGDEVTFSPESPLYLSELEVIRGDVFTHRLTGLLPAKEVSIGNTWQADPLAIRELTDLLSISTGTVECKLVGISSQTGEPLAEVTYSGKIEGLNKDGINVQEISGIYKFDLQKKLITYLSLQGKSKLLDSSQQEQGSWTGRLVITRRLADSNDLPEQKLKNLTLEPTQENTLLLFTDDSGFMLLYPRRWQIKHGDGKQWTLTGPGGTQGRFVLDSSDRLPTVNDLLQQAPGVLQKSGAEIKKQNALQPLQNSQRETWSRCYFEGSQNQAEYHWDYAVLPIPAQKQGLIFTIRFPAKLAQEQRLEVEMILKRTEMRQNK